MILSFIYTVDKIELIFRSNTYMSNVNNTEYLLHS